AISNRDDEIAAGLGRKPYRAGGVEWCRTPCFHPAMRPWLRYSAPGSLLLVRVKRPLGSLRSGQPPASLQAPAGPRSAMRGCGLLRCSEPKPKTGKRIAKYQEGTSNRLGNCDPHRFVVRTPS